MVFDATTVTIVPIARTATSNGAELNSGITDMGMVTVLESKVTAVRANALPFSVAPVFITIAV